ncbi:MAG: hypothetical protein ACFCUE_02390 [Candidatus Bathyarchaeia archaeon]
MTTFNKTYTLTLTALLIALTLLSLLYTVQAQNITKFTPQDTFENPEHNGTIRFAVNGTYTAATLESGTWTFNGLTLNGSRILGTLEFSAKNCDVTIYSYYSTSYNSRRLGYLRYYVEGVGEQVVNLGFNTSKPSNPSEWTVIAPGNVFLAEGENWRLLPDDTLVLWGVTGNLTVARYNYGYPEDNRPFYQQHSIIILTAIAVAVTVTVATVIKLKTKARQP